MNETISQLTNETAVVSDDDSDDDDYLLDGIKGLARVAAADTAQSR